VGEGLGYSISSMESLSEESALISVGVTVVDELLVDEEEDISQWVESLGETRSLIIRCCPSLLIFCGRVLAGLMWVIDPSLL